MFSCEISETFKNTYFELSANDCFAFLMTCINMKAMFRKFAKGPEQNLSIICKDSIYKIAILENQSKDDLSDSKENYHRRVPLP